MEGTLPLLDEAVRRYLELLRQLAARMSELLAAVDFAPAAEGPEPTRKELIARFIRGAVFDPVDLSALASRLGVSAERARHIVTEELAKPIGAAVTEARMAAAAALLSGSRLSISEIADRVWYRDAAAFARAFRRVHGVSPSLWRATRRA